VPILVTLRSLFGYLPIFMDLPPHLRDWPEGQVWFSTCTFTVYEEIPQ